MHGRKIVFTFLCLLIFSHIGLKDTCQAEITVLDVYYRDASELLPMVEALLSPGAKAAVDMRTNSIVISDNTESLEKIRKFLVRVDRPLEQITIRFWIQEQSTSITKDMSASGTASENTWSVSTGEDRREGVHVRAQERGQYVSKDAKLRITVPSGSAAYISLGEEIPFTERWVSLCRRHAHLVEAGGLRTIETGMEVRPVVSGDRVHVEIIPRISYLEPGEKGVIRFTEASTRVSGSKGEWIRIGGHGKNSNEVIKEMLSCRSAQEQTTVSFSLMVEP